MREHQAAADADGQRDAQHHTDDQLKAAQQRQPDLVGLANLQSGAVRQPRRGDFQDCAAIMTEILAERVGAAVQLLDVVGAPRLRFAHEHGVVAERPEHPDEEPFLVPRPFLELDRAAKGRQAAEFVARRVLPQRRADDVVIALRQRRGEQRVGDRHQSDRADGEDRRVPDRQSQPERAAQRAHGVGRST